VLIRLELAFPGNTFFSGNHQLYNVVVIAHALLMIFLTVMPVIIRASDIAFPHLNNTTCWLLFSALLLLNLSALTEISAGTG
jgi:cytochrome c oxidase subunit 1